MRRRTDLNQLCEFEQIGYRAVKKRVFRLRQIGYLEMQTRYFEFGMIGPHIKGNYFVDVLVLFDELQTVKNVS